MQLSVHSGWESDGSIEFLRTATGITDLKMVSLRKVNLAPLTELSTLRTLTLRLNPNYVQSFDFKALRSLKGLAIDWNEGFDGVWQSSLLETLEVDGIKKVESIDVSLMKCLKNLGLRNSRSVQQLNMGQVRKVEKLSLILLPKLRSIQGRHYGKSVTHLSVAGLKNLDLKYFRLFRALQIVEVGMQDRLTREDLSCVPEHFLQLP